jgi:dolichol-phosphate mannosyltransferase
MEIKTLIFIPTYNESGNAANLCEQIFSLNLGADVLFIDDNSPDGTGRILDGLREKYPRLVVKHRPGKQGVGSAHLEAIAWAYEKGYGRLITLDCDFTHSPTDILKLLSYSEEYDVVVGSRFLEKNSLPEWKLHRRFLTHFGHFLTRHLLKIKQDATGAFRVYRLSGIPPNLFTIVKSRGYSFFFESLFLLTRNQFAIKEVPIVLPNRTYGNSKMAMRDIWKSVTRMLSLFWEGVVDPGRFRVRLPFRALDPKLVDPQDWNSYWDTKKQTSNRVYEMIAEVYRTLVIRRRLNQAIRKTFAPGSRLLHAGCGSGQVDTDLQGEMRLTAVDISPSALELYQNNVRRAAEVRHASIFCLPFADATFDGVYNLGVMEHFTESEIGSILREFHRVLAPGGKLVLFWPHHRASSVLFLKGVHWLLNDVLKKKTQLHPPEISLFQSKASTETLLDKANLTLIDFYFGPKDFYVQAVIVARKK